MNFKLKALIVEKFGSQCAAARVLGLSEPKLSRIIRGWEIPGDQERRAFSREFGARTLKSVFIKKGS